MLSQKIVKKKEMRMPFLDRQLKVDHRKGGKIIHLRIFKHVWTVVKRGEKLSSTRCGGPSLLTTQGTSESF